MKIILTGATGFVGSNILAHLIADSEVMGVTCLTRRSIDVEASKVTTILQEDFTSYDPELLDHLSKHDACIWALGGKVSDLGTPEVFARITHTFTLTLAEGIASRADHPFTFCYLSGMGADPSESTKFPWEKLTRHLKGRTEKDLQALHDRDPRFRVHCFRPAGILPDGSNRLLHVLLAPIVIGVGELSDAMITGAKDANLFNQAPFVSNNEIKRFARARLQVKSTG